METAMKTNNRGRMPVAVILLGLLCAAPARGQVVPWVVFEDTQSASTCDLINAANAELVLLSATAELVIVTGVDLILTDTFVDLDGFVYYAGFPAGVISFAEDADGFRTLWWTSSTGRVVDVDPFTGEPSETAWFPSAYSNVPCDACDYWDDPADCGDVLFDTDEDGVPNGIDLCPNTPFDEFADADGCSCSQLDSDLDGVDDCYDLCASTPLSEIADFDGCSCSQLDSDLDGVDDCNDLCSFTPLMEFADFDGCSCSQLDSDLDGVDDCNDLCPNTLPGRSVDGTGCPMTDLMPVTVNFCGTTGAVTLTMMFCGLLAMGLTRRRRS
jgi:hypothetical protein